MTYVRIHNVHRFGRRSTLDSGSSIISRPTPADCIPDVAFKPSKPRICTSRTAGTSPSYPFMPVRCHLIFCLCMRGATASSSQRKISTVSMWALQSPHDDVLCKIWRHIVVCLACAKGLCVINPRVANSIPFFTGIGEPHRGFITFYSFCAQFDRNIGKFCLC